MKALAFSLALMAGAGMAAAALAQPPGPPPGPQPPNLIDMPGNTGKAHLTVTSADIKPNTLIPHDNSAYGKSLSPQVSWTKGPASTKSYVVALEDADAHTGNPDVPITHWLAFNIPANVTSLPGGLPPQGTAKPPAGFTFAKNIARQNAYFGPRTPPKTTHHYHLEVLALDTTLPLMEGATRAEVASAMSGHVVATGEVVGLFTGPDSAPPPAGAPAAK
jgi:Raf kinase inhibitor-like YbhB/YbcL family protein